MTTIPKFKEKLEYTLSFTHKNGKPAKLTAAYNDLTGNWIEFHSVDGKETAYVSNATQAKKLMNKIASVATDCKLTTVKNRLSK